MSEVQSQAVEIGNFINPSEANKRLIDHLQKLIAYYSANPIENPADIGIAARTFMQVVLDSPVRDIEAIEDFSKLPFTMFNEGNDGEWLSEAFDVIGFNTEEIERRVRCEGKQIYDYVIGNLAKRDEVTA